MKECFGKCGGLRLKWSNRSDMHYLVTNEEKMSECQKCDLFAQCAWQVQIRLFKELIKWCDEMRHSPNLTI